MHVVAPCHESRDLAGVVIEVKWSTNPETKSGLVEQLGERYLSVRGPRHGVFLVGWSGEWFPGGNRRRERDIEELRRCLIEQRNAFTAAGQKGEGLRIEPVVIDLRWRITTS